MTEIITPWSSLGYITYKRCVDKDTLVLKSDLEWIKAKYLKEGDSLLVFDEELIKNKTAKQRYIHVGKVLYNKIEKAMCVGIELSTGEILYCTPDHKWLVSTDAQTSLFWREAKDLEETKKHTDIYLPRPFGKPWYVHPDYEYGYLGAALDGEGCLDRTNSVQFIQVQNSMLVRVERSLTDLGYTFNKTEKTTATSYQYKNPRQQCFSLRVNGFKNILRLLGECGSSRLVDKLQKNLVLKPQRLRCTQEDYVKVIRVFDAGEREVAVLSTSHGTHFTAGFPSHNTYARRLKEDDPQSPTEEWQDTVDRIIRGSREQLGCNFTDAESERLRGHLLGLRASVAGRFLWQLGSSTVDKLGLASLQNCACVAVDEPIRPFTWAMDMLN